MSDTPSAETPPAGWYPDGDGNQRWWDGVAWTDAPSELAPEPAATPDPTHEQAQQYQQAQPYEQQPYEQQPAYGTQPVYAAQPAYAGMPVSNMGSPPPPPWGSWTWPDGSPIDMSQLPPYDPGKKLTSGLLGIFLGGLGIHKFILGYTNAGIIQIVATIFTCGFASIIGLIEGIMYLTKSDAEFYWTYVAGKKEWF